MKRSPWFTSVLVIEDDDDLRTSICNSLLMRGFFVEATRNVREAAALVQRLARDVVVTDARVADEDCLSRIRSAQAGGRTPAVILVSKDSPPESESRSGHWVTVRGVRSLQRLANRIEELI